VPNFGAHSILKIMKDEKCGQPDFSKEKINFQDHWNQAYLSKPEKKLGWYEVDLSETLHLLMKAKLDKKAHILIAGAGSTTLVDELLTLGYSNLTVTDISKVALDMLAQRVGNESVQFIVDDLTQPQLLEEIAPVDLWLDRAVLHFFTEKKEEDNYFDLLKRKVKSNGYVLLAEFSLDGLTQCSNLPVKRYSVEMFQKCLGASYRLKESFDYGYVKPSTGEVRPYVYALLQNKQ